MLDYLQASCWTVAYLCLIVYAKQTKLCGIPRFSLCANFAWETCALVTTLTINRNPISLCIHGAWFLFDSVIVFLCWKYTCLDKTKRWGFVLQMLVTLLCMKICFNRGDALIASYQIDATMALDFVLFALYCPVVKSRAAYGAAFFKLAGDVFAWLNLFGICFNGVLVLLLNATYGVVLLLKRSDAASFRAPLLLKKR